MNDLVRKLYHWTLLAPALLPLLFVEGMMYPLMAPKTLVFRGLGIIALTLFIYLVLAGRSFYLSRLKYWGAWVPAALLLVAYAASAFGPDFYHSFWSTFERGDGLLTLSISVIFFYLILISVDASWLSRLFKFAAWVGTVASIYLIIQWIVVSFDVSIPFIVKSSGRIGGTMGNAAFLASYLGLAFFATLSAAREYSGFLRTALYAGAALEIVAIILTATRGTMLALILVLFAVLGYASFRGLGTRRTAARTALIGMMLIAATFFLLREPLSHVPLESIRRLASISLSDVTVSSRLFLWTNVSREALSHPLLGYGAEHIDIPFDRVYDPSAIIEEWFDRTHNAYLDYFVQFGVIGAALYAGLVALLVWVGLRLFRQGSRYGPYLLGGAVVYAIQNFFVFDTVVTAWLFFALIAAALVCREIGSELRTSLITPRPIIGGILALVVASLIIPVSVTPWRANLLAFEAYLYQIVDVPRANAAAKKALELGTYADLELGYNAYFMYTEEQIKRLSGEDLQAAYTGARDLLAKSFERYPYDARTAVYLAQVLSTAPEGMEPDGELLSQVLARAIEESPKRLQPWYVLANVSIDEANTYPVNSDKRRAGYRAAADIIGKYTTLVPGVSEPYFILAQLEYALGDKEVAATHAASGKERYTGNLGAARRAVQYYETVFNLPNAAFFLREVLRFTPDDENARADLSQIEEHEQDSR